MLFYVFFHVFGAPEGSHERLPKPKVLRFGAWWLWLIEPPGAAPRTAQIQSSNKYYFGPKTTLLISLRVVSSTT